MTIDTILRHLENTGFHIRNVDDKFIYIEDPFCILRHFDTFINYAWIAATAITAMLLFGWAISMIRGAKNDILINLRNLTIIFGVLSAVKPAINFVWGDNLFNQGCKTINVSIKEIQKTLAARDLKINNNELYEDMNIYDSYMGDMNKDEISDYYPEFEETFDNNENTSFVPNLPANNRSYNGGITRSITSYQNYVIYTDANGNKYRKLGGTIAWRNNNPGNIRYNKFVRDNLGAIGSANGFAVFADEKSGIEAVKKLLQGKKYFNLTIAQAINRYAPSFENDTEAYKRKIQKLTGIPINTTLNQLSDTQMNQVVQAIKVIEGYKPGKIMAL